MTVIFRNVVKKWADSPSPLAKSKTKMYVAYNDEASGSFILQYSLIFTARCTLVQSAVLPSHVVCLSVTLVDCDHIGWNSSKIISTLVSLGCSLFATPTRRVCSKGNTPKFGPKVTHPLLIWASETFDRKLRPNGYRERNGHNGEPIGNYHRSF